MINRLVAVTLPLLLLLAFSSPASALSITTASIVIGGPDSLSSEGTSDPGLLSDGTTPGAHVDLTYDPWTGVLALDVFNDGPSGSLTGLFFNVPSGVTGATLDTAGATYTNLIFSLDGIGAGGFGSFDYYIGNSTSGSPAGGNPGSILVGDDETVGIAFSGPGLGALIASDFTDQLSVIPPGSNPTMAVGRFQSGLQEGSGFISDGHIPEPATLVYLLTAGAVGVAGFIRRRK